MLKDFFIPAFFGFCILVALTLAVEFWTGHVTNEELEVRYGRKN